MSTPLTVPPAQKWNAKNITPRNPGYAIVDTPSAEIEIDNLVPGHTINVTLKVWTQDALTAAIDSQIFQVAAGQWKTITAAVTLTHSTFTIRLAGSTNVYLHTFELEDTITLSEFPIPADVISVQAYYSQADLEGLRLDTSRWNRARFTHKVASKNTFIWNESAWDTRAYYSENETLLWQDITPRINSLQTYKAIESNSPVLSANIGTLTFEAIDALDPRATGLSYGAPIKVIHWPTREVIWSGLISDIELNYAPPGSTWTYRVTFTAVDSVAALAAITRYGAKAETQDGSETWSDRITRLMRSAPTVPYTIDTHSHIKMCATVWETNLASHLDAAVASVNGMWKVDRNNITHFTAARPPLTPEIFFTDAAPTNPAAKQWSFNAVNVKWKASELIAAVYLTNHATTKEEGQWHAEDTNVTAESPTFTTAWAGTTANIDTTLVTGLNAAARALLRNSTDYPTPQSITFTPCHRHGAPNRAARMAAASTLETLTPAAITLNGDTHKTVITGVSHTITPYTWTTTITFTANQ